MVQIKALAAKGAKGGGVSRPLAVSVPDDEAVFVESVHAQDFAMSPRVDGFHKIVYVLRGRVRYEEEGRAAERAGAGTVIVVPMRRRHALVDEEASTLLLLGVGERFSQGEPEVADVWRELTARRRVLKVSAARGALESLWRRALLERAHPRVAAKAATRALALQVFVQLARLPRTTGTEDTASRVATVAREIEQTFFERWTIDGAAERAGMSRRHFTAQFRAATGKTFWEFLTNVRLEHAAELLRRDEHSIAGVVFACGFGDVSQFYRLFRGRYGVTPGSARARS